MKDMSMVQGLLVAVSGFVVVFLILVVISLMIKVISYFVALIVPSKTSAVPEVPSAKPSIEPEHKDTFIGEVALINVDEKTAACIMAIVSDETKIPLNELIFKTIKAL